MENSLIRSYGQIVRIVDVEEINGKTIYHLEHPIVVPTKEYTRSTIEFNEIQEIIQD